MRKMGERRGIIMRKTNFFESNKELAKRTSEFFRIVLKKAELGTIYSEKISANETSIASINDILENGSKIEIDKGQLLEMKEKYIALNESLKKEWDKLVIEQATFEYTPNDKKFKNAVKKAASLPEVCDAIEEFFKAYNLEIANTSFEQAILQSIGKKINVKTIVLSNGKKALVYDATNALKNLYAVSFEWMIDAGTIKPADIPSVLVKKYAKKEKAKKNN